MKDIYDVGPSLRYKGLFSKNDKFFERSKVVILLPYYKNVAERVLDYAQFIF